MKRLAVWFLLMTAALAWAQDKAQAPLPTTTLTINGKSVTAEVADDDQERSTGLMFRQSLAQDSGMLFVMPQADRVSFWMRNTLIPLSIAYINPSGRILEIHSMKPRDETPIPSAFSNVAYALEMEDGWFDKNGIMAGDRVQGLPQ